MIHGPCGIHNKNSVCMSQDKSHCTKNFPKKFNNNTIFRDNGYPLYRRRNDGSKIIYKTNRFADNGFVVPYNPYLLLKLECHINVEICSTIKSIKYLFKYVYKGPDTAMIKFTSTIPVDSENIRTIEPSNEAIHYDEIANYISTRYICPPEAMYRIQEMKLHEQSHAIYRLPIHLENEQQIYFKEGSEDKLMDKNCESQLTQWFHINKSDEEAKKLLYSEMPLYYVYHKDKKTWIKRKKFNKPILVRIYYVNPTERERFFLRLLLLHVRGAESFQDIRTYNKKMYNTYYEACVARNLLKTDDEWDKCLEENIIYQFPNALCQLFAYILSFDPTCNGFALYNKYKIHLLDPKLPEIIAEQKALKSIERILKLHGLSLKHFNMTESVNEMISQCILDDIDYEPNINIDLVIGTLTVDQKIIFEKILQSLNNVNEKNLYFIDGPGGSGKSYLLNTFIRYCKFKEIPVISVAWTGIAAMLLIGGKTVHSTFKLPLSVDENSTCNIIPNSDLGKAMKNVRLIIWDEISMTSKCALDAVNTFFRDICDNNQPFGGKIMIISGDFRQTLPIVRHGSRTQVMESCVKRSMTWPLFTYLSLKKNLRLIDDKSMFKTWLLNIGENKNLSKFEIANNVREIPIQFITNNNLIDDIFGMVINENDLITIKNKVILSAKNNDVLAMNDEIVERIKGESIEYLSIDFIKDEENNKLCENIPIEFLNSLTPNGLPPHKLLLKKGVVIILLRNLDIDGGLCNGTRLIIKNMLNWSISAEIITGKYVGKIVWIPRIDLSPSIEEVPFKMVRRQFPIRLGFAMTINKSQGQSFEKVGLYLLSPVFSHGQLYVALSRVKDENNLKVKLTRESMIVTDLEGKILQKTNDMVTKENRIFIKNIVFQEVFEY